MKNWFCHPCCIPVLLFPLLGAHLLFQPPYLDKEILDGAMKGDVALVADLLAKGAAVNADNGHGITPLYIAADWANLELVKLLLQHGADPDSNSLVWGKTPLMVAAVPWSDVKAPEARAEIVKLMVKKGAGAEGDALVDLIRAGHFEAVRTIVGGGKVTPSYLNLAFAAAKRAQQTELADLLAEAGAKEPGPLDGARSPERLALIAGVYRNESGGELTLGPGLEPSELMLQRGQTRVALSPIDLRLLQSRDRKVVVRLKGGTLPPSGLTLRDRGGSEDFTWTAEAAPRVATETRPARVKRRAVTAPPSSDIPTAAGGREWPSFRGPSGSGVAEDAHPPTEWDVEKSINIKWKVPIPGFAHSSPIIWSDRVFVTTAIPASDAGLTFRHGGEVQGAGATAFSKDDVPHSWQVYALDLHGGKILWNRVAREGVPRTARHVMASQANQTPATDGKRLVVWFGSEGLYCYDFDGKLVWNKDLGPLRSGRYFDPGYEWNTASSPIIYKDLVILQVDLLEHSYITALDIKTGKEIWRTGRDELPSWSTPLIYEGLPRTELVTAAAKFARGYDANTGEELWRVGIPTDFPTPTPIAGRGLIFVTAGYGTTQPIYAIRPGGKGDITPADDEESNAYVGWSKRRGGSIIPTPIFHGDLLYVLSGTGILAAYQAETGERVYQARVTEGGSYSASPVAADGKLYFANEDGEVIVVKAGPKFERLAVNQMGELIMATPAISKQTMIIRTQHHVVAVAESKPKESVRR